MFAAKEYLQKRRNADEQSPPQEKKENRQAIFKEAPPPQEREQGLQAAQPDQDPPSSTSTPAKKTI